MLTHPCGPLPEGARREREVDVPAEGGKPDTWHAITWLRFDR
jgi:hypothetical protein